VARADRVFLDRVLTNLIDNAARASSVGGGGVDVVAARTDGRVTIRVVDHGRGVPLEARELLFQPFYELDQRNPRLGRGLGLAIAKGFTVSMDGEVWVEDTPGGGATLALSIPASEDGG
jgi:two-component system sensor histidine kinase KdpD